MVRVLLSIWLLNFLLIINLADAKTLINGLGDCQTLMHYDDEVDAIYNAGVDVRGRQVKSAEYNDNLAQTIKGLSLNLDLDITRKFRSSSQLIFSETKVGQLRLVNGKIFLNSMLITKKEQLELLSRCRDLVLDSRR